MVGRTTYRAAVRRPTRGSFGPGSASSLGTAGATLGQPCIATELPCCRGRPKPRERSTLSQIPKGHCLRLPSRSRMLSLV